MKQTAIAIRDEAGSADHFAGNSDCPPVGHEVRAGATTRGPSREHVDSRTKGFVALSPARIALLAIVCVYFALFIYRTSFTIGGIRYFCLFDDDMISMRYAANLAHHYGLV